MSSTITTGKKAAVMIKPDGTKVFALFEKMHESNCYPHTPRWSCIALGEYAAVMKRVFSSAAACEGGCLQSSGRRRILPENYIAAWRRELASPVLLGDSVIRLRSGGWSDTVSKEGLSAVCSALSKTGRLGVAAALQFGNEALLSLHADIDAVLAIYGVGKIEPAWRAIQYGDSYTQKHPELGQEARIGAFTAPSMSVVSADQYKPGDNYLRLVKTGNGDWVNQGWSYSAVQNFITDIAYHAELAKTGSAKALISAFREQCENAPRVPENTPITFVRCEEGEGVSSWHVENLDKLAGLMGCGHTAIAPDTFTRSYADIQSDENKLYLLSQLAASQVKWSIGAVTAMPQQLDLLAA